VVSLAAASVDRGVAQLLSVEPSAPRSAFAAAPVLLLLLILILSGTYHQLIACDRSGSKPLGPDEVKRWRRHRAEIALELAAAVVATPIAIPIVQPITRTGQLLMGLALAAAGAAYWSTL